VTLNAVRLSLAMLAAGALGACAAAVTDTPYLGTYNPTTLNYIADKGPLYTEIVGNPFAVSDAEVGRAVTEAMYGAHFGQPVRFTTERDPNNPSPYRVVVLFNPGRGVTAAKLCQNSQQTSEPATGNLRVMAALCAAGYRETSLTGTIAAATSPDDAAFRGLIRQMTAQLFPPRNPNIQNSPVFEL